MLSCLPVMFVSVCVCVCDYVCLCVWMYTTLYVPMFSTAWNSALQCEDSPGRMKDFFLLSYQVSVSVQEGLDQYKINVRLAPRKAVFTCECLYRFLAPLHLFN